jgi:hypothetical protein
MWDTRKLIIKHQVIFRKLYNNSVHCSALQLVVTAYVVPSSLILFTLMMEAISSSETKVVSRATRRHIPEGGIFQDNFGDTLSPVRCSSGK